MKVKYLFKIAALLLVAALSSCSSDDFTEVSVTPEESAPQGTIPFTTAIGAKDEGTRALEDAGDYIHAFWADGKTVGDKADEVAVIVNKKKVGIAKVDEVLADGTAIIKGTVNDDVKEGDNVTLLYPAYAADVLEKNGGEIPASYYTWGVKKQYKNAQDGTLKDIADKYAVALSEEAKIVLADADGQSVARLSKRVNFKNQNGICKFRFKKDLTDQNYLKIKKFLLTKAENGKIEIINYVEFAEPTEEVYIAMPPTSGDLRYRIAVDGETDFYSGTAKAVVEAGMFYDLNDLRLGVYKFDDYVDMGNAGKWAFMNVGAFWPGDYGDYFAWGETKPKEEYTWETYKFGTAYSLSKYTKYGDILELEDDAAYANWGTSWRMPTETEMDETTGLLTLSNVWYDADNNPYGVAGRIFTAENGNTLFLPAAGYRDDTSLVGDGSYADYWSSTLISQNDGWHIYFNSGSVRLVNGGFRYYGFSVRAVRP